MPPLGGGVYWRWVFKREERLYKKSILGGALIEEGRLKERERAFIGENTVRNFPEVLYQGGVLKNFSKFTSKYKKQSFRGVLS